MEEFKIEEMQDLYKPATNSNGEDNGQITIIGGSDLFHGAPLMALKTATKVVDMVFFTSPSSYLEEVTNYMKAEVGSFIWIPFEEVDKYIEKSDAVLIGPGFKRYGSEHSPHKTNTHYCDDDCKKTREVTERLLKNHPNKKWVIDAGSLQTMDADWIPENAILTPNQKEFEMLFGQSDPKEMSEKYNCNIVLKKVETVVCSPTRCSLVKGGNAGLTKGGTGDVLAGLTAALYAKNDAFLSACAASLTVKRAAEQLAEDVDVYFSADDLAYQIPATLAGLTR